MVVVEDDVDSLDLLRFVLEGCGATVVALSSALEGARALRTVSANVLVTDISMPDYDGFWLLREVRKAPGLGTLPVLAITGVADLNLVRRAGFDAAMQKPFDPERLCGVIADMLSGRD